MKIIKVPITEYSKQLFHSIGKSKEAKLKWEELLNKSQSMTAEEFWKREQTGYNCSSEVKNWFFVVGKPESIIDELVNLKMGESNVYYPWISSHSPEDLIESRTDWERLKELADEMYYFIGRLYDYI